MGQELSVKGALSRQKRYQERKKDGFQGLGFWKTAEKWNLTLVGASLEE